MFLSVVLPLESGERALRIRWQRTGDPLLLSGHVPADVFLPDSLSSKAASEAVVRVMLNEGTLIAAPFDKHESEAADGNSIVAHNQSTRYPLVVTATVSRAAVFAEHADLRAIATAGGAVLALLIIALAVLISAARPLQSDRRDGARARSGRVRAVLPAAGRPARRRGRGSRGADALAQGRRHR